MAWKLADQKLNEIQLQSIRQLIKRCAQAHYVDVIVRITGKDERYEADWLKHLCEDQMTTKSGIGEGAPETIREELRKYAISKRGTTDYEASAMCQRAMICLDSLMRCLAAQAKELEEWKERAEANSESVWEQKLEASALRQQLEQARADFGMVSRLLLATESEAKAKLAECEAQLRSFSDLHKRFDRDIFDDDTAFADWVQSRSRHLAPTPVPGPEKSMGDEPNA